MNKTKGIVLTALCLVPLQKVTAKSQPRNIVDHPMQHQEQNITTEYPEVAAALAKQFMAEDAEIFRGTSKESLSAARYDESQPLTAILIGDDQRYMYFYLENCDICAVLVRSDKNSAKVEILKQEHTLSPNELHEHLLKWGVKNSICNT